MARVLYISYTGLLEPLGQSQVLQYLAGLSDEHEIELISFEKPALFADTDQKHTLSRQLADARIQWHPLKYHKRFSLLATSYDLLCMLKQAFQLDAQKPFDIVHCRSYIPAIAGAILKKRRGTKFIFDMRGFWADERVDGGIWKAGGLLYRNAKRVERWLLTSADHLVSLTQAGVKEIEKFHYMAGRNYSCSVIPTCTNLEIFDVKPCSHVEQNSLTVGVVGSVGTWNLFDDVLRCFLRIRSVTPNARLLILNRNEHEFIHKKLRELDIPENQVELVIARYTEVSGYMACMDFGLFFNKPFFSRKASAPTKLGEFLACGIPCLTNAGVGDVDDILQSSRTGVCIAEFSPQAFDDAYTQIVQLLAEDGLAERCRQTAEQYFSLEQGVNEYKRIYSELAG